MKSLLLAALLFGAAATGHAQCDKPVVLTSSKTEYLDASGTVQRTEDENSKVEIIKDTMIIAPGNEPHIMRAHITSQTCNWTVPFKEGKSVIHAKLPHPEGGADRNLTITLEGKEGVVTLHFVMDEEPDQSIRVKLDSFQEKT